MGEHDAGALPARLTMRAHGQSDGHPPSHTQETERVLTDGGRVVVPISDRDTLRVQLRRFGGDAFAERPNGALTCDFTGVTHFTVLPDGRIDTGMPRHAFEGPADRLVFDHERGEVTVEHDHEDVRLTYTFRRP